MQFRVRDMIRMHPKLSPTSSAIVAGLGPLAFLLGLAGSEGASLTSDDTLKRRSPLFRRVNLTLRRLFDMVRLRGGQKSNSGKGRVGEEKIVEG